MLNWRNQRTNGEIV